MAKTMTARGPRNARTIAVVVAPTTLAEADAAFSKAKGDFKALESKTKTACWSAINALAEVVRVGRSTGLADTAIWSHLWERKTVGEKKVESGLLKGEDSDLISRWRRAAFGIANGKTPEAGQSLKDFAVTCNDDVPRTGNAGGTGKRDVTDASRAKGLRAAEEAVIALGSRLAKWSPSKETTKALTALQEALGKDATAAEAAVAAKKTAAK